MYVWVWVCVGRRDAARGPELCVAHLPNLQEVCSTHLDAKLPLEALSPVSKRRSHTRHTLPYAARGERRCEQRFCLHSVAPCEERQHACAVQTELFLQCKQSCCMLAVQTELFHAPALPLTH